MCFSDFKKHCAKIAGDFFQKFLCSQKNILKIVAFAPATASSVLVDIFKEVIMATYHFSLKQGKVGKAKMHCDYINREGRYANGKMKEELVYKESGNLPIWAKSATDFFAKADVFERANGNAYTEFEMALPAEISLDENIKLVKEFVKKHVGENKVYAFAIHEKMAALNPTQRQPHVHLMFSERVIDDKNKGSL